MPELKDRTGERFGQLLVLGFARRLGRHRMYLMRCDCGVEKEIRLQHAVHGLVTSCSRCKMMIPEKRWSRTPTHNSWQAMLGRCRGGTEHQRKYWADQGVTVCERWLDFKNFLADMGPRKPHTSLDRYPNPNGNYEPGNCRWATLRQQRANRR